MFAVLLLRNTKRNLPRLRPMIAALVSSFALLYVGNAISSAIDNGYSQAYRQFITADGSISPLSHRNFTVFGSEALLLGEYFMPPIFPDYETLESKLKNHQGVQAYAGLISLSARVQMAHRAKAQPLFGIDFEQYGNLLPEFKPTEGRFPTAGEPGILLNRRWLEEIEAVERGIGLGSPVLITVAANNSFTIREVPLTGIFEYPISDPVLDRLGLIDLKTARALNGYFYNSSAGPSLESLSDSEGLFESIDNLFGSKDNLEAIEPEARNMKELSRFETEEGDNLQPEIQSEAWNFILIRLNRGFTMDDVRTGLIADTDNADGSAENVNSKEKFDVKGWRQSAGGNAVLIWVVQLFFNAGLIFIAAGAAVITVNALVLSILERRKEIGTMRALGASRFKVGALISAETLVIVIGTGTAGIIIGSLIILLINILELEIHNPVLVNLFGRNTITGRITTRLVFDHALLSMGIGFISVLYPLKKALGITPVRAMAQT